MARTPNRRPAVLGPEPDEARGVGLDDKQLPGGQPHIVNHPVAGHAPLAVSHAPYYSGVMAHGVIAPDEDGSAAWHRYSAPGGKSTADLAREHGLTAGTLLIACRDSEGEPGGLVRSELDELGRQVANGTGVALDAGTVYVVPAHGAAGRITAPAHQRAAHAATGAAGGGLEEKRPDPIPVYVVDEGGGARPLNMITGSKINVPAPGGQPVQLSGKDPRQNGLLLLNESSTAMRIADTPGGAATGAILPASMTSYLWLPCQGPLYVIADTGSSALILSLIREFAQPGAG